MSCRIGKCISKSREYILGVSPSFHLAPSEVVFLPWNSTCGFRKGTIFMHATTFDLTGYRDTTTTDRDTALYNPLSPTTPTMTVISDHQFFSLVKTKKGHTIFFPTYEIYSLLNSSLHKWTNGSSLFTDLSSFRT